MLAEVIKGINPAGNPAYRRPVPLEHARETSGYPQEQPHLSVIKRGRPIVVHLGLRVNPDFTPDVGAIAGNVGGVDIHGTMIGHAARRFDYSTSDPFVETEAYFHLDPGNEFLLRQVKGEKRVGITGKKEEVVSGRMPVGVRLSETHFSHSDIPNNLVLIVPGEAEKVPIEEAPHRAA